MQEVAKVGPRAAAGYQVSDSHLGGRNTLRWPQTALAKGWPSGAGQGTEPRHSGYGAGVWLSLPLTSPSQ